MREVNGLRANGLAGVLGVLGVLGVRKALGECATMLSKLWEAFAKKRMETAMFSLLTNLGSERRLLSLQSFKSFLRALSAKARYSAMHGVQNQD